MPIFPKIEKITRDATISHFFLMFGYKLFSLYFPLFLVSRNFSLPQVGYTYLLIYLPIAIFAPFVGFLSHKINPAILASLGIFGYSLYALGMIFIRNPAMFYFWQVLLGISAALFFVSSRAILMASPLESYDRAFGWFYTAPFYADAFAPVVGALIIWKFNFVGVFIFSLVLQFFTAIFFTRRLGKSSIRPLGRHFNFQRFSQSYQKIFQSFSKRNVLFPILISFSVLLLAGLYSAFFILFLKNSLSWSKNLILFYTSLSSFLFLPLSIFLIRHLEKIKSEKNIFQGGMIAGFFSILFGAFFPFLNFLTVLLFDTGRSAASLVCNSGRSGLVSHELKETPEEAGAVDTIFSPLGVALGALISGLIIGFLGYQLLFILGGVFIILVSLICKRVAKI